MVTRKELWSFRVNNAQSKTIGRRVNKTSTY